MIHPPPPNTFLASLPRWLLQHRESAKPCTRLRELKFPHFHDTYFSAFLTGQSRLSRSPGSPGTGKPDGERLNLAVDDLGTMPYTEILGIGLRVVIMVRETAPREPGYPGK
jgi:hypothetical protein